MSSLNQGHNKVQLNETFKIVNPDSQSSSNNDDSKFCISGSDFQALTTYFGQPAKMPVSELQELCIEKKLAVPHYQTISQEGPSHCLTFKIKVIIQGFLEAEGIGKSKQAAKHDAATNALSQLKNIGSNNIEQLEHDLITKLNFEVKTYPDSVPKSESSVRSHPKNTLQLQNEPEKLQSKKEKEIFVNPALNPISQLQEFCAKKGHPIPSYDYGYSEQYKIFSCKCTCVIVNEEISSQCQARSKSDAKKMAAEKCLNLLIEKKIVKSIFSDENQSDSNSMITRLPAVISSVGIPSVSSNSEQNLVEEANDKNLQTFQFYEKISQNEEVKSLLDNCSGKESIIIVDIISNKLKCQAEYFEFSENGKFNCLLNILPKSSWSLKYHKHHKHHTSYFTSWATSKISKELARESAASQIISIMKISIKN